MSPAQLRGATVHREVEHEDEEQQKEKLSVSPRSWEIMSSSAAENQLKLRSSTAAAQKPLI